MNDAIRGIIKRTPLIGRLAGYIHREFFATPAKGPQFPGTEIFWENRYASGDNSGVGSYGFFSEFKAEVLNEFVASNNILSVLEFGCGDGNQLQLAKYPEYIGFDVSSTAVELCRKRFAEDRTKSFFLVSEYQNQRADLTLSLDVIFHLIEDQLFETYMRLLFGAAKQFVIIYSSNTNDNEGFVGTHVRHRKFTDWVEKNLPEWKLVRQVPNRYPYHGDYRTGSFSDFFFYRNFQDIE